MYLKHIWPIPKIVFMPWEEIADSRDIVWIYTRAAWEAVNAQIRLPAKKRIEIVEASELHWNHCMKGIGGEVIYAVGGGLAADAAKYIAFRKNLPLVILPTALSADAFLTWASGVRSSGAVKYLETKPADEVIIDFKILNAAPENIRAAGICDVLSIATGRWDWRFAHEKGNSRRGMEYIPYIDHAAKAILQGGIECAEAAGRGDMEGLKQLLDCLSLEVQLCNQLGHSCPEEGSEHYFAYSVENAMGKGLPHGDLVGPGIIIMAQLQEQDPLPLVQALEACNISLNRIPNEIIHTTLLDLPDYCRRHQFPYGIAHEITPQLLEQRGLHYT